MNKALVLIDFENEWVNKDSDYYVGNISSVIEKTNQLIKACRELGYKIIFTRHVEPDSDEAFSDGSKSVELISELKREDEDVLITKYKISPFYETNLEQEH